jgi:hypothetical protein
MLRLLFAAFLVAHGLVHIAVWTSARTAQAQGTHPDHSWILGDRHSLVVGLTYAVVVLFVVGGIALLFGATWWVPLAIAASAMSILLVALFPGAIAGPWIIAPLAIDVGLIATLVGSTWPVADLPGA